MEIPCRNLRLPPETNIPGIRSRFETTERSLLIRGQEFHLLTVCEPYTLLDHIDPDLFALDERMPYWAELWPSSIALAEFCLVSPQIPGASILELGCGLGLAGIAATRMGARVVLSDYESDALEFARFNISRNISGERIPEVIQHDWRVPLEGASFNSIIAADVLYEQRNITPLLNTLDKMLERSGTAVFADPGRTIAIEFLIAAGERGYSIRTQSAMVADRGHETRVDIHELRRVFS